MSIRNIAFAPIRTRLLFPRGYLIISTRREPPNTAKTIMEYIPIGVVPAIFTVAAIKKTTTCITNVDAAKDRYILS